MPKVLNICESKLFKICSFSLENEKIYTIKISLIFLLTMIIVNIENNFSLTYLLILISVFAVTTAFSFCTLKRIRIKRPNFSIAKLVLNVLTGNKADFETLTLFVVSIVLLGWATDYSESISWGKTIWINLLKAFISIVVTTCLALEYSEMVIDSFEEETSTKKEFTPTKIVMMAISRVPNENQLQELKELIQRKQLDPLEDVSNKRISWILPLRMILASKEKIEKFYALISKEGRSDIEQFKEIINLLKESYKLKDFNLIFIENLDFDSYSNVFNRLETTIRELYDEGYLDEDITINISGGTSAVTSALIIIAVREGRQVTYFTQSIPSRLMAFDVNLEYVSRAVNEILND